MKYSFDTYLSPFTWRYGSDEMRTIWSEKNKRLLWRKIWIALAEAEHAHGLLSKAELDDLKKHQNDIDIEKAHEFEKDLKHDLMAEIKTYASQAKLGGGKLHMGATSMDIEDNADALRIKESLQLIEKQLRVLLKAFAKKIEKYKNTPCLAYTHLQPAEPTTLGYRFALYAQDLFLDLQFLAFVQSVLKGKGMKGAVGTAASYTKLLDEKKAEALEKQVMDALGIEAITIASQVSPRKLEFFTGSLLSSISQSLYKFAFDLRLMQSPGFGEWSEPFGDKQVGSSAMPFKRNPIHAEQICSLGRLVMQQSGVLEQNASHMLLERTLDDSANRRVVLPEIFLAIDTMLSSTNKLVTGLVIRELQMAKNLALHGPFSGTESIMMIAVKNGADRQDMHEILRNHSLSAYETMSETGKNPLPELLKHDKHITKYIPEIDIDNLLDPAKHLGLASKFCDKILGELRI